MSVFCKVPKCLGGKMSECQNVGVPKCCVVKMSAAKMSFAKMSFAGLSVNLGQTFGAGGCFYVNKQTLFRRSSG